MAALRRILNGCVITLCLVSTALIARVIDHSDTHGLERLYHAAQPAKATSPV